MNRLETESLQLRREFSDAVGALDRPVEPWLGPSVEKPSGRLDLSTSYKPSRQKCAGEAYIYGLADPRDHAIRYVGKTQSELEHRLWQHEFNPSNRRVCSWLKELRRLGMKAEVAVLEICPKLRWRYREEYWIGALAADVKMLNRSPGGRFDNPSMRSKARSITSKRKASVENCGPVRFLSRSEIESLYGRPTG